jgi:hypothetical protein
MPPTIPPIVPLCRPVFVVTATTVAVGGEDVEELTVLDVVPILVVGRLDVDVMLGLVYVY